MNRFQSALKSLPTESLTLPTIPALVVALLACGCGTAWGVRKPQSVYQNTVLKDSHTEQGKPSAAVLNSSLRTIKKAVASCSDVYTHMEPGNKTPTLQRVLSDENYKKDMLNLRHSVEFTDGLLAHPQIISGRFLVTLLSVLDDLSVSAGSSRFEVVSAMIAPPHNPPGSGELVYMSEELANCQKGLFNATDDYVTLVTDYVGDEDDKLSAKH